ncbi:spidroin-1-like [Cuculus canorus]|uniref:spidroin-1-like n=1 Tax=Cuculus canorus TaxID=55661 RepID=UPI0023AABBC4|nr:spidroin-1-like [Cuculus canorus]
MFARPALGGRGEWCESGGERWGRWRRGYGGHGAPGAEGGLESQPVSVGRGGPGAPAGAEWGLGIPELRLGLGRVRESQSSDCGFWESWSSGGVLRGVLESWLGLGWDPGVPELGLGGRGSRVPGTLVGSRGGSWNPRALAGAGGVLESWSCSRDWDGPGVLGLRPRVGRVRGLGALAGAGGVLESRPSLGWGLRGPGALAGAGIGSGVPGDLDEAGMGSGGLGGGWRFLGSRSSEWGWDEILEPRSFGWGWSEGSGILAGDGLRSGSSGGSWGSCGIPEL